jgi:EmrB/QacA subfamily drug resistance transporter
MTSESRKTPSNDAPWAAFLCVAMGVFMATLDGSIVSVALPFIRADLDATLPQLKWVLSIYLLVVTGLLLVSGRMADLLGHKRVYLAGLALFTAGSGLCAASRTAEGLIAARGAQGVGAAMLMACGPAIITAVFPPANRGKGLGMIGTVVGVGLMSGPPLGGLLLETFGWQSLFLINLPIGVATLYLSAKRMPALEFASKGTKIDGPGALLFTLAIGAVLLGLDRMEGGAGGFRDAAPYGATAVLATVAFLLRERSAPFPLVDLSLFRRAAFSAALAASVLAFLAGFIMMFLGPFYLAGVRGLDPLAMGLTLTIIPALMVLLSPWAGTMSDRIGHNGLTMAGLALRAAGIAGLSFCGASTPFFAVVASLVVIGVGTAIFMPPNTSSIMGAVPHHALGVAGGLTAVARNLGMALGVGIGETIFSAFSPDASGRDVAAFLMGWRAAMLVAFGVSLAAVAVSFLRDREERP